MFIQRCNVNRPGIFENKTIEFDNEITVIYGRNNSGKTLLSKTFVDVFFLKNNGNLLDKKSWENMYVEMQFIFEEIVFKIVRNNFKLFSLYSLKDNENLIFSYDLRNVNEEENYIKNIAMLVPDNDIIKNFYLRFDNTSYADLCYMPSAFDYDISTGISFSNLKKIFVEDDREFCEIHRHLQRIVQNQSQENNNFCVSEKEINALNKELKELERQIAIIDLEYSKYEKLIRERSKIENSILQKKKEIDLLVERRKIGERILENQHRISDLDISLNSRLQELAEEKAKRYEIEKLQKKSNELFPQFKDFNEQQKANLKKIQDYYRELRDANEILHEYLADIEKKNNIIKSAIVSLSIASLVTIMLVLTGVLVIASPIKKLLFITFLLGLDLVGVVVLLVYNIIVDRSKKISNKRLQVEELVGRIELLLQENNVKFSGLGMEPLYEFLLQYFEEYSEYTELQMDILQLKNSLKSDHAIEELEKEINILTKRKEEIIQEIEKDRELLNEDSLMENSAAASLEYIFSLEKKIEMLEQDITYDSGLLVRLDEEIRSMSFRKDEKAECLEKKKKLVKKLEEYVSRHEAIKYILKIFKETEEQRWNNIKELIIQHSEEIFHELTNKVYITTIDREIFNTIVEGVVKEDRHRSIIHMILLSVKIALTDFLIDFGYPPPLILDDPFLYMDKVRMSNLKEILERISKKRQIIIFTHMLPFEGWGKVVEL